MTSHFVTLLNTDPDYRSYLLGTFSVTERAIPVETFGSDGHSERVTFQVVPVDSLKIPVWWKLYLKACRPSLLGFTMGPAVATWLLHARDLKSWQMWPSWFAVIGIFFLHASAFMLNDYQDHMYGTDRMSRGRGSQLIQKGWVSAQWMLRWAWVNLFLVCLFAGLASFQNPPTILGVAVASALCLLVLTLRWGARFGLCDLGVWLLFGPLISIGVAATSFGQVRREDLVLGAAIGLISLFSLQLRQVSSLFRSRAEAFRTFLGFLSYDTVRKLLLVEGLLLISLQPLVALALRMPIVFLLLQPLFAWPMARSLNRLQRAASPLSSEWLSLTIAVQAGHLGLLSWWILGLGLLWLF